MKKILIFGISLLLFSCGAKKTIAEETKPLFEVIAEKPDGGAKIQFYEIISESKEFLMIKNDPDLKGKVKPNDILNSNFAILNLGEKNSDGYSLKITKAEETNQNVILTLKEITPQDLIIIPDVYKYPFCLIKINSKKEIIFQ
jgi:hypothetical protein